MMHYDIFPRITRLQTVLLQSIHCKYALYGVLYLQTRTNHVCDYITLNYTSMTHRVGNYQGAETFYRDLTRITVSDTKSQWI